MPSPLNLIPRAVGQQPPQILHGFVSSSKPAPVSFASPLYVVIPQWNPDYYWQLTTWPASNGSTLPVQGAECVLVLDDQRTLRCLWWSGATGFPAAPTTLPPNGPAGGDLGGTYPNPTLSTVGLQKTLQLAVAQSLTLTVGDTGNVTAPAWAANSWATFNIAHGLGVIPKWAGAVSYNNGGSIGSGAGAVTVHTVDATNIVLDCYNNSAFVLTGGGIAFRWAAIK